MSTALTDRSTAPSAPIVPTVPTAPSRPSRSSRSPAPSQLPPSWRPAAAIDLDHPVDARHARRVSTQQILERLAKLGLGTNALPNDRMTSATSALLCLPMYMVSNVHGWTDDRQFLIPVIKAHGLEAFREAFVIGAEKATLTIDEAHAEELDSFLAAARASDRIVYEYALETLRMFLGLATPILADWIRGRVAEMIVRVANAAGKEIFGSGDKVSAQERACILQITQALDLRRSAEATRTLATIGVA